MAPFGPGMSAKTSETTTWQEPAKEMFILHVEDNPDDRTLFQMAADQAHVPVVWQAVESADDAITYLTELESRARHELVRWPDLMLLDIRMPRDNGTKVLHFLKANQATRRFPVIVLTGLEDHNVAGEVRAMGAQSVCFKPQSFDQLIVFMDSLYRGFSRSREKDGRDSRLEKKFLVLCFKPVGENRGSFSTECERAGSGITWMVFETPTSAWNHMQTLMRLKYMKTLHWPDLLLLDLTTNDDGGWTLLRMVRSAPEFHSLPVIAITPPDDREAAVRAQKLGAKSLAGLRHDFARDVRLVKMLSSAWNEATQVFDPVLTSSSRSG